MHLSPIAHVLSGSSLGMVRGPEGGGQVVGTLRVWCTCAQLVGTTAKDRRRGSDREQQGQRQ